MILRDLIHKIEEKYPTHLAESWDNVGLMIGDYNQDVKRVLVSLEANEAVIDEAISNHVDLIITHHPFLFSKMNQINTGSVKGSLTLKLIQNQIAVYSMHTNYDIAFDGMNDAFLKIIGFAAQDTFHPASAQDWYIQANGGKTPGLGRICTLDLPMTLADLSRYVKEKLNMSCIRFVGDANASIRKIAVITGAAADYYPEAQAAGADVLISGDMKYHIAQDALDSKMNVIDCGHFETENIFRDSMREYLESICDLTILSSQVNLNPFQIL